MLAYIQHSIAIRPLPLTAAPRGEIYLCLTLRSRPLPLARDPCPCLCGPGTLKGKQTHNGVVRKVQSTCCPCTPIIIDTSGNGFVLTSAASGVKFDMSGRGYPVQIAWTAPGSTNAFLALPAADGLIHSGLQLFGNYSPQPPSSTPNGFAALAVYDDPKNGGNGDGIIDSGDAIFSYLRLWIDTNHDGVSQPNEYTHCHPSAFTPSVLRIKPTCEQTNTVTSFAIAHRSTLTDQQTPGVGLMTFSLPCKLAPPREPPRRNVFSLRKKAAENKL